MVSVEEAVHLIHSHRYQPGNMAVPLTEAVGKVLAETVKADRDFPPYNRVTMDGIAVSYEQLKAGQRQFEIEGIQPAGSEQRTLMDPSKCIEVMTGAVLPRGVDVVIKYEETEIEGKTAIVNTTSFKRMQNVHTQGFDGKEGEDLLMPGTLLSSAEIALLASVGKSSVLTKRWPVVSIVSTGDELVSVDARPQAHQVRMSNTYALHAALQGMSSYVNAYHLADDEALMTEALKNILFECDVLILSGGVSKGKFDYVPGVLETLQVKKLFYQVKQRPGKPFWFGTCAGKTVFALPGNPVSTYMCFYKYVKPWLMASLGLQSNPLSAVLAEDFTFKPDLTCFLQVKVGWQQGTLVAYPIQGGGSGDFANLAQVDGFLQLPPEKTIFKAGEVFNYIPFRLLE